MAKTTILKEYYWEFYWEFHITMFSIIRILKDPGKIVMFFSAFEASTGKKLEKKHGKFDRTWIFDAKHSANVNLQCQESSC